MINFKNETHNHPTEIEPFGGAATCLGGAIRDPLSGRTYVYQAMRVTGAADPTVSVKDTLKGKLPQKKTVYRSAAHGYSSYGNQIGLATGYVKEVYHPNYVAKRMEIGAVMGAAPRRAVIRENSDPGDIIILLGGRTGRDGYRWCNRFFQGSYRSFHRDYAVLRFRKVMHLQSVRSSVCSAEKKSAILLRNVMTLVQAVFPLQSVNWQHGLRVDLDKVPKKYAGLDGTEIAISESQERMAVVVDPKDVDTFLELCK